MKISKTSVNFAERRKFKIVFNADNSQVRIVRRTHRKTWTVKLENHMRGLFFQKTNLPFMIKEELPYWVENGVAPVAVSLATASSRMSAILSGSPPGRSTSLPPAHSEIRSGFRSMQGSSCSATIWPMSRPRMARLA